jgi:hypothetical protein
MICLFESTASHNKINWRKNAVALLYRWEDKFLHFPLTWRDVVGCAIIDPVQIANLYSKFRTAKPVCGLIR